MGKQGLAAIVGVAFLAGAYALMAWEPAPLRLLRNATFDQFQRLAPREPAQHPVAVVDIDDASLAAYGQWPWPRALLGDLVDRIGQAEPAVIALDIVFPEPDRMGAANDEAFAAALGRHPTVLAHLVARSGEDLTQPQPPDRNIFAFRNTGSAAAERDPRDFARPLAGIVANLPALEQAAAGMGVAAYDTDDDGVVRHVPLVLRTGDGVIRPGLALEALRVGMGQSTILVTWNDATGLERIEMLPLSLPIDALGRVWPHFAPWDDARRANVYVSAKDVLQGNVPAERLRHRFVLIGTSAPGLFDMTSSPVDAVIPGVDIHAQALEGLIDAAAAPLRKDGMAGPHALLDRPSWAQATEATAMVAVGLVLLAAVLLVPAALSLPVCIAIVGGLIGGSWYLFAAEGMLLDLSFAAVVAIFLYAVLMYLATLRRAARRGTASP